MASTFNQINQLKGIGLTWEELGRQVAQELRTNKKRIARNTLRAIQREPHYKPGNALIAAIDNLHQRYFPSPFPAGLNALMRLGRQLMQNNEVSLRQLELVQLHVQEQLRETEQPPLFKCRLHWILGNIEQFRMREARLTKRDKKDIFSAQAKAVSSYQSAMSCLEEHALPDERYKLIHNVFVCYVNAIPEKNRNRNRELKQQLELVNYLELAYTQLSSGSFMWNVARNALLYSSITQDRQGVADCFKKLIQAHGYFSDLSYRPLGHDSILEDPSLKWALHEVLTPNFVEVLADSNRP